MFMNKKHYYHTLSARSNFKKSVIIIGFSNLCKEKELSRAFTKNIQTNLTVFVEYLTSFERDTETAKIIKKISSV